MGAAGDGGDGGGARDDPHGDADRMLLAAVDAAPLGMGVLDPGRDLVRANPALGRVVDPEVLRRLAPEALTREISLRLDGEAGAATPVRARLFPVGGDGTGPAGVGVVVDDPEPTLRAGREALDGVVAHRLLAQATVDALAAELAILDEDGRILMVNRAWREFGAANDEDGRDFVGTSYLAVCDAAAPGTGGAGDARAVAAALRELIAGRRERFEVEYPCHSPTERRWFMARAARFTAGGVPRVVITHENITARRHSEDRHRHIARTLQAGLLPAELPRPRGLEVAARYRAQGEGLEVGGDFYDVFPDGGGWVVVIGDVCGKGAEAAAVTAEARWTIRALAEGRRSPAALLGAVNRALTGRRRDATFLSAVVARVHADRRGARLSVARAGHPPPIVRRAGGAVEEIDAPGGLLGLFEDESYAEAAVRLGPGDALVLVTDGVTEARAPGGEELGQEGLRRVLARAGGVDASGLAGAVETAALERSRGLLRDDLAVLVVRAASRTRDAVP